LSYAHQYRDLFELLGVSQKISQARKKECRDIDFQRVIEDLAVMRLRAVGKLWPSEKFATAEADMALNRIYTWVHVAKFIMTK
jgi:hypothetical protein